MGCNSSKTAIVPTGQQSHSGIIKQNGKKSKIQAQISSEFKKIDEYTWNVSVHVN